MSDDFATHVRPMVRSSYDTFAPRYAAWADRTDPDLREPYTRRVLDALSAEAVVVELGCGPGIPVGSMVADRCRYIGVDLSFEMLREARHALPSSMLVQGDMAALNFKAGSVDAVLVFFSLFHIPREKHAAVLRAVARWLRPGGFVAAIVSCSNVPVGYETDWLGAGPMFWSSFDREGAEEVMRLAGLEIVESTVRRIIEEGDEGDVLCLVGRRPDPPGD